MKIEFPIKHIHNNLVFGHNKSVWAYFKVDGFSYDFLDDDEKMIPFHNQLSFLTNTNLDLHLLIVPTPTNIEGIIDHTIEEMGLKSYSLKEYGMSYMKQVKEILVEANEANETSEYTHYLGIQLDSEKNKYTSTNVGLNAITSIKSFFKGLNSPVYSAVGLEPTDLLEREILAFENQAKIIGGTLSSSFVSTTKPVTTKELLYITEKSYSTRVNHSDIKYRENYEIGQRITGIDDNNVKHHAYRTERSDFYDLQNTHIEEYNPKTLLLSSINEDGESESVFSQYLTVSHMESGVHPSNEWLYRIQSSMPFPFTVSIRADHQVNEVVKKRLSNVKLEYEDQRKQAHEGGQNIDLSVSEGEMGANDMEKYFQQTGYPAYALKIVFKIVANSEENLALRVDLLKKELTKYNVKILSPYGEQLQLMLDTIPSSERLNDDYVMHVDPRLIAGLMFGATTNIGDNRGFYIGHTSKFGKPVFIQPDLAAKAYEGLGNVVDSLSALVAGATGKGKSFFMNLFCYLSVLTGSTALIIDPKGDRKKWVDGLPYIDREFIEVWTLGSDEKDAGSLDPFRTSTSMQEAKDIAMDILSYLANVSIEDVRYSILSDAVEKASKTKNPCIGEVLNYLDELYKDKPKSMSNEMHSGLENLKNTLETMKRNQISMLLFGEPNQDYKKLEHKKPLQVLMIQNLTLPDKKTKSIRPTHKISEAIMISITAWTKQYMLKGDRSVHKIILQDEASAIERNAMGSELMDHIVRQGRYYNTTLLKGSQNASDYSTDVANMGMKYSFGLREKEEAEQMLKYYNLPVIRENVNTLKNLDRGEALFQDIYGRTAMIRVNPIFEDLFDAFDSSTSTEEEKARERERETSIAN